MKLLIVDNDRDLAKMLTSWLRTLGYEVQHCAHTGERAKIDWEKYQPNLVINVCTANQIVSHIWGFGEVGDPSLIKAHIRHLRQKIEPEPSKPYYILTVSGVGYTLIRRSTEDFDSKKQILFLNAKEADDPHSALSQ